MSEQASPPCANYDPRDKCRLCQGLQTDKACYKKVGA